MTSSLYPGDTCPIPIFPSSSITILGVGLPLFLKSVALAVKNCKLPSLELAPLKFSSAKHLIAPITFLSAFKVVSAVVNNISPIISFSTMFVSDL